MLAWSRPAFAQSGERAEVAAAAQREHDQVIAWRRDIHQHPELSNREERTSALVAEHLRALGLKPLTGIAHHGVVAIIQGGRPGPKLALRADMDALPVTEQVDLPFASKVTTTFAGQTTGVMHACGHDAHTSILLGVADALVAMRKDLPGAVMLVFQPSEEGAPPGEEGGASLMLEEGLFKDFKPDAMFGLHVFSTLQAGQIGVRSGPLMAASDKFTITVTGRQTHGSSPWAGIDPVVAAADIIGSAQTHRQPPHQHRETAGRGDFRRDPRRHPLQHHPRLGGDGRHHPHVRSGHAHAHPRRPVQRRRTCRDRQWRQCDARWRRTASAIRSPTTIRH